MMGDLKHQFLELLADIGFVPANVARRRRRHEDRVIEVTPQHVRFSLLFFCSLNNLM